jgi:tetratricopeptide (TPR) repeat protein
MRCGTCDSLLPAIAGGDGPCPYCALASAIALGQPVTESSPPNVSGYQTLCELGRGAMGVVWLARDLALDRLVALKRIDSGTDPRVGARLLREGRAVAQLQHPHIVTIYMLGEAPGGAFLAMEFLEGGDLQARLKDKLFAPREAAELTAKLADALAHAHARGLLHRDIKPSNILLDLAGEPHLADFGLAAPLLGAGDLTAHGQILGTPAFLAPELLEGAECATPQSDIYGLGAVLYTSLTGRAPFAGETAAAIFARIATADPPSPRALNPEVPPDLETICLTCLEKSPSRRYSSADALREDLRRFLEGTPVLARPPGLVGKLIRWGRRRPALAATFIIGVGLGGPVLAWQLAGLPVARIEDSTTKGTGSPGGQLAARTRAIYEKPGFTRDDLALAEDLARHATDREPGSAATWGVRAGVHGAWIFRGWDTTEQRLRDAQSFANQALSLDPNEAEALVALGFVLYMQGALDQAEAVFRRGTAVHPDHVRLARALGFAVYRRTRKAEARTVLLDIAHRFPRDPLVHYDVALSYGDYGANGGEPGNLPSALQHLDQALALQPFSSALTLKAALIGGWRADLNAMRAVLLQQEKLPVSDRSDDRAVYVAMWAGLLERRPDRVEAAAALTARTYFDDRSLPLRPKGWPLALAHRLAGKANRARADWESAERVLRQRLTDESGNMTYQVELAITLAWLGQHEEATRLLAPVEAVWKEEPAFVRSRLLALYYGAAGDAVRAAAYLPQIIDRSPFSSRQVLPLDPWWDKLRGQPEFEALLREPVAKD